MSRVASHPTAKPAVTPGGAVPREKIAMRAYEKWLKHGRHGRDLQDWLEAEAELKAEAGRGGSSTTTPPRRH
jgi:hypothetical protein